MKRLGITTGVVGLAWAVAFAVMGLEWYFVALTAVFAVAAAAFLARPVRLAPTLPWLYVGAVAYVWLAIQAPVSLVGVGFALAWGAIAFAGLMILPLMAYSFALSSQGQART